MKYGLYVVHDAVAEDSGPPFQAVNDQVAKRQFAQLLENAPETTKADYLLFRIAEWDSSDMQVKLIEPYQIQIEEK